MVNLFLCCARLGTIELEGHSVISLWLLELSFTSDVHLKAHLCHLGVFGPQRAQHLFCLSLLTGELMPDHPPSPLLLHCCSSLLMSQGLLGAVVEMG